MKEYYSSIFSSFKVENGNCIHKEDQEFLDKVIETIEKNITNPDLSVELLSSDLGYSTRQFYRKLKPITDKSPADITKEYLPHNGRATVADKELYPLRKLWTRQVSITAERSISYSPSVSVCHHANIGNSRRIV